MRGKTNLSRGTRRHVGALAWRAAVQGGAGGRGSPAWPKSANWAGVFSSGLLKLTQKVQGRIRLLTAGLKRAGVCADCATATSGGEDGAELGEVALQGLLRSF